jgi:hypothetical protein
MPEGRPQMFIIKRQARRLLGTRFEYWQGPTYKDWTVGRMDARTLTPAKVDDILITLKGYCEDPKVISHMKELA